MDDLLSFKSRYVFWIGGCDWKKELFGKTVEDSKKGRGRHGDSEVEWNIGIRRSFETRHVAEDIREKARIVLTLESLFRRGSRISHAVKQTLWITIGVLD